MSIHPVRSRWIRLSVLLAGVLLSTSKVRAQSRTEETPPEEPSNVSSPDHADAPDLACPSEDVADPLQTPGQEKSGEDVPYWRTNFFHRFFRDQGFLFKTWIPSEVRNPAFSVPFFTTTALAIASSRDANGGPDAQATADFSEDTQHQQGAARFLSDVGDTATGVVLIGVGYLSGRWSHHDRFAEASSLSAEAALSAGLWSSILKAVTARTRPEGTGTGNFGDYSPKQGEQVGSFPSGHATGAFAVATVFAGVYSDHRWVPWVAYGTAGLIGASRLALSRHFPTDVVAGALLGNSMGRMVLTRSRESAARQSTIMPIVSPLDRQLGLVWNYSW
jgi:membrane-associated phospholipid phosphatase